MVEHAAALINTCGMRRRTRRTPFEDLYGRAYRGALTNFGRQVMYRLPSLRGGDMGERFAEATWLGKDGGRDAHIVAVEGKVTIKQGGHLYWKVLKST